MALIVTHTTAADGTFSSAGATAWNATHAIAGTLDLATETTGSLDLLTRSTGSLDLATRTTGSLDLLTRSTGTIDLLTQTRGATATQLMYGGASGQVAQSLGMVWDAANSRLTVTNKIRATSGNNNSCETSPDGITKTEGFAALEVRGFEPTSGSSSGGGVILIAGEARTNGDGGTVLLRAGGGRGLGNYGGNIDAVAGTGPLGGSTGYGGNVSFQAGSASGASAFGGQAQFVGGFAGGGGTAGDIMFFGGSCGGSTGTPGNIVFIVGGQQTGSAIGTINISSEFGIPIAVTAGTGAHAKDLPVIVDGVQYYIRLYS